MKFLGLALVLLSWAVGPRAAADQGPPKPGSYQGYSAEATAHVRLQLGGNGRFTARVTTLGGSAAAKGQVGGAPVRLTRLPGSPVLAVATDTTNVVRGRLDYDGQAGQVFSITRGFTGRIDNRAPLARDRINAALTIAGGADLPDAIEGAGFFTGVMRPKGTIRLKGRLPDNSPLSRTVRATAGEELGQASVPVVIAWGRKAKRQSLTGQWMVRTPPNRVGNHEVLSGQVNWTRPDGDSARLRISGGRWPPTATVAGRNVLGNGIGEQRFILVRSWLGLVQQKEGLMEPHPANRPDAAQPLATPEENLLLKVNPRTGVFEGSFMQTLADGRDVRRRMAGIVTGYFVDREETPAPDGPPEIVEFFGRGLINFGEQGSGLVELIKPPPGLLPELP